MRKGVIVLIVAAALGAFCIFGGLRWVLWHGMFAAIAREESALQSPPTARATGRELARLCQTCKAHPDWFKDEPPLAPAWTPGTILKLHPTWVSIAPDSARVEFGGGFLHFGYALDPDPGLAVDGQRAWFLTFYSEDNAEVVLDRFTLPADDALTEAQFVEQALAELDRRIAANSDALTSGDPDAYASVQRCHFALKHHQADRLRVAIRDSAVHNPLDWRDVLLAYLIDRATGPGAAATALR